MKELHRAQRAARRHEERMEAVFAVGVSLFLLAVTLWFVHGVIFALEAL